MPTNNDPRTILRDELLEMIQQLGEYRCKSSNRIEAIDSSSCESEHIVLSICPKHNPTADLRYIINIPRCEVIFHPADIKVYKSYRGQTRIPLGTFEYADPHLVTQLLQLLDKVGLKGICRAEHYEPEANNKPQIWQQFTRFRDRRSGEN